MHIVLRPFCVFNCLGTLLFYIDVFEPLLFNIISYLD